MLIPCKCPGRLRRKFFKVVVGRGKTGRAAKDDMTVKEAQAEQKIQDDIDRFLRSVRCDKGCKKHVLSATATTNPIGPDDLGDGFVSVQAVSGFAYVFCRPEILIEELKPPKKKGEEK